MTTIGIVGLGRMGGSIAERLLDSGYDVVGYDVDDDALEAFADLGGEPLASPKEIADAAAIALTSLPTSETVESVYRDDEGLLAADGEALALEMSTIDPDTTDRIREAAAESAVRVVDAPISGGPEMCRDGTVTLLVGAEDGDVGAEAAELFDALASEVFYFDQVGGGHTVKLLNNVMSLGNLLLATEAMSLGAARGLDGADVFEALKNAGGSSAQLRKRVPRILDREFEPGFTIELGQKDLGLALETAEAVDHPMLAASTIFQRYTEAKADGYGEEDFAAIVKLIEDRTGVEVEAIGEFEDTFEGY